MTARTRSAVVLSIISFSVQRLDVCEDWIPLDDDEKETTSLQLWLSTVENEEYNGNFFLRKIKKTI